MMSKLTSASVLVNKTKENKKRVSERAEERKSLFTFNLASTNLPETDGHG